MESQNSTPEATNVFEPMASGTADGQPENGLPSDAIERTAVTPIATEPKPSYVKLAMRNMVRKRGVSLKHFALTTVGLLGVLIGLSYLTR